MQSPVEIRPFAAGDAEVVDGLMSREPAQHLQFFSAFQPPHTVAAQSSVAVKDRYAGIWADGALAGFYCLRGFDQGYERPSFGIYVASAQSGRGLARQALRDACAWCAEQGVKRIMLKVYPENVRAYKVYADEGFADIGPCPDSAQRMMEKVIS